MRPLLALALLLASVAPAHALLITEWDTEYVFLGVVGNSTDPTKPFNMYEIVRTEVVYDVTEGGIQLVSSRVITAEEFLAGVPPQATPEPEQPGLPRADGGAINMIGSGGAAQPTETPDPATWLMIGASAAGVAWWRKRRGRR